MKQHRLPPHKLTRRRAALHEAGHAVIAHHNGDRVLDVELRQERGGAWLGWATVRHRRINQADGCDVLEAALCAMAGSQAETGRRRGISSTWDAGDTDAAASLGFDKRSLVTIAAIAKGTFEMLWADVERVANALMKTTRLSAREFEQLVGERGSMKAKRDRPRARGPQK